MPLLFICIVLSLIKIYLSNAAAAAAAHSERSVLKAETFRCLEESQSLDEFLRANTGGSSPLLFPTLLGLRLAEDFDLGTRFETRQNTDLVGYYLVFSCISNTDVGISIGFKVSTSAISSVFQNS